MKFNKSNKVLSKVQSELDEIFLLVHANYYNYIFHLVYSKIKDTEKASEISYYTFERFKKELNKEGELKAGFSLRLTQFSEALIKASGTPLQELPARTTLLNAN